MNASSKIRALVVDDEPFIRFDLMNSLERAGYDVEGAASAAEAITVLERDRAIRVVFTDIMMPGDFDGLSLARVIRHRWPPTLIVICSANLEQQRIDLADIHMLNKPYFQEDLSLLLSALSSQLH